jgi:acetyl esterase/lipase
MTFPLFRKLTRVLMVVLAIALVILLSFRLSPWPGALLIRLIFDKGGVAANEALAKHVPPGLVERLDLSYDPADPDATFDLFLPSAAGRTGPPPVTVVWIHGGAYISGSKDQIANYARVLAGRGFAVVGVTYSIAPGSQYPVPLHQVNAALGHLRAQAAGLGIDASRLVLAGDSAGAHLSAQLANAIRVPAYAQRVAIQPSIPADTLAGVALFCGPYGIDGMDLSGDFGSFMRTVIWAYLGEKNFEDDPRLDAFTVTRHVTAAFPPAFISVGNIDPLAPQSYALAEALKARGAQVDTLFFPADHAPALNHEYQFNLDSDAGKLALERLVTFLNGL